MNMTRPGSATVVLVFSCLTAGLVGCQWLGQLFSLIRPDSPTDDVAIETIVSDAQSPVDLAFTPDGRVFYTEKNTGRIRVIKNGALLEAPFATLSVDHFAERGLLGIAAHPDFATNHFLYVYYSKSTTDGISSGVDSILEHRITRFVADADVATLPEEIVATLPGEGGGVHNGGILRFAPDGTLYVTLGDLTVPDSAQDVNSLAGKMLRYNDDGTIPADNPFGPASPVFALGLRNTFGHGFDAQGRLFGWENGSINNDEVNRIDAGANLGWPQVHGMADGALGNPVGEVLFAAANASYADPLVDKNDGSVGAAGLAINPGDVYGPDLRGQIFYGELRNRRIMRVRLNDDATQVLEQAVFIDDLPSGAHALAFAPDGYLWAATGSAIIRLVPEP